MDKHSARGYHPGMTPMPKYGRFFLPVMILSCLWLAVVAAGAQDAVSGKDAGTLKDEVLNATNVNATLANATARAGDHIRVRLGREWFREGESVEVHVFGFPGNRLDWATIVPYGASDEEYREVQFARGRRDPVLQFKPLAPGRHELRIFFDEPGLEDVILYRYPLWVGSSGDRRPPPAFQHVVTGRHVYGPNRTIEVRYENMPGNEKDWLTIVPAGAPRDHYGETMYTKGRNHGNFTFAGFPEGEYEVRAYYDWPMGGYRVRARSVFRVRPADWDVGRYTRAGGVPEGNMTNASAGLPGEEGGNETLDGEAAPDAGNETADGDEGAGEANEFDAPEDSL